MLFPILFFALCGSSLLGKFLGVWQFDARQRPWTFELKHARAVANKFRSSKSWICSDILYTDPITFLGHKTIVPFATITPPLPWSETEGFTLPSLPVSRVSRDRWDGLLPSRMGSSRQTTCWRSNEVSLARDSLAPGLFAERRMKIDSAKLGEERGERAGGLAVWTGAPLG